MAYHLPVLLHESIEALNIVPNGTYLDLTFGGGGHSREIIKHLSPKGRLIAFDQDSEALANAIDDSRFLLIHSNFRYLRNFLKYHKIDRVNGILADLGISSHHIDSPKRGFSFRFEGPLDMRMNRNALLSAEHVINSYDKKALAEIFSLYGELPNASKIAAIIEDRRQQKPIKTVEALADLASPLFQNKVKNKMLAKLFQAIRIEVNQEIDALKQMLMEASKTLDSGGHLVVISYHSLEDRLVKNFFKTGNFQGEKETDFYGNVICEIEQVNRKVIVPSPEEVDKNPRARSAKLRVGRKK